MKWLDIVGWLLIAVGVIGGLALLINIDYESYNQAKDIADELWDNEYAEQEYILQKEIFTAQLSQAIAVIASGIISGIFFLALDKIIVLLKDNKNETIEMRKVIENQNQDNSYSGGQ